MSLPRSKSTEPRGLFYRLMNLHKESAWTTSRSQEISALLETIDDNDEREVLLDLLERFRFFSGDQLMSALDRIAYQITHDLKLEPQYTRICSKHIGDGPDSSEAVLQSLKAAFAPYGKFGWNGSNFNTNVRDCLQEQNVNCIVVVDDFNGTGNQLQSFCEWFQDKTEELGRTDVILCAMFVGMMQIAAERKYPSVLSELYCTHTFPKAISEECLEPDRSRYTEAMKRIEKRCRFPKKYQFGYGASETIYFCETLQTPNNVFPIFWMRRGQSTEPIFPRL